MNRADGGHRRHKNVGGMNIGIVAEIVEQGTGGGKGILVKIFVGEGGEPMLGQGCGGDFVRDRPHHSFARCLSLSVGDDGKVGLEE